MELQQRTYSCGPAALRAALYLLGHNVLESTIRKWARTTPQAGTDEYGLIRAIEHYGHRAKEYQVGASGQAWQWLKRTVSRGHPVLLCVDGWGHWVTAIGFLGARVLIFDPEHLSGKRRHYSGLQVYTEQEFAPRWRCVPEHLGHSAYYGLSIIS